MDHGGSGSDEAPVTYLHTARQNGTGRHMHVATDHTMVLYDRARVDECIVLQDRVSLYYGSRHYLDSLTYVGVPGDQRGRVQHPDEAPSAIPKLVEQCLPQAVRFHAANPNGEYNLRP